MGGRVHDSFPIAWTLASGSTERDIAEAEDLIEKRIHNIFKVKIGKGDPQSNVAHVLKIKEALGSKASVRVDVNQAWDEPTSVRFINLMEKGGVDLIEQPVPRWNIEAMAKLFRPK